MAEKRDKSRREAGARQQRASWRDRLQAWRGHHGRVALDSLRRLWRQPLSSGLTWLVIGIALALPASLYVGLENIRTLGQAWDGSARISLYLSLELPETDGRALAARLTDRDGVRQTAFLSREEALAEFRALSGFGEVLDRLRRNPLPAVITVTPEEGLSASTLQTLREVLQAEAGVDQAQLDLEWVQRLHAMIQLAERLLLTLGVLLALGVLLVIGNTIRLAIENRRDEIVVTKLVGGTDAFVRRPFLYTGLWYGLGGGLAAWLIVLISLLLLGGPVADLADLYDTDFALRGLGAVSTLTLWGAGAGLGLGGAWLAVSRHLGAIEPR